ncbi:hypothetical protein P170DRAFT_432866 [Aspergillus steynii IBT 23096]|uniref:Uncharacterized protein n=1 Tax=Aspergillus steynii IBT 23096 TaxID=1392250 RepID=A0A2I2GR17_9EURO|nr:uncharacterized protein P170DRAFT_432866 [Aspergillus steynii IBT 23096]PLB55326.1 hypothetical protein P170DRAFT_432866 [Aspergillus steynii IBT 23096]
MSNANQPSTGVRGGASAIPTPANNADLQGGASSGVRNQGAGHVGIGAPMETEGGFLSLNQQKGLAENHYGERAGLMDPNAAEDRSFAQKKPGAQDTLPGWEKAKDVVGNLLP